MKTSIILFVTFLCFVACGSDSGDDVGDVPNPSPDAALPLQPAIPSTTDSFGRAGNLWKPKSDERSPSPGNLVVLLSSEYAEQFDSCEVVRNTGEVAQLICINDQPWTQTPFSCFSNGGRQTWRANFKCSEVAEVKVTCKDTKREVVFTVPEANRRQVCGRF